ncbi:zf-HC2 domain-containing protein [soil metagenome]
MTADETRDSFALWDAAYVLGSLSSTERREYENHLSACRSCQESVGELSGMPALLALLDRDEMAAADDERPADPPPLRPEVLAGLLEKVSSRRRRTRWLTWSVAAAAAVVLAVGVFVAIQPGPTAPMAQSPSAAALTMTPVMPSSLDATVTLSRQGWGTRVEMACTYAWGPEGSANEPGEEADAGDKLAMVAVSRDGNHTQLATWMALSGTTAVTSGSTSMPIEDIVAVQVVSADTGDVLLQRNL